MVSELIHDAVPWIIVALISWAMIKLGPTLPQRPQRDANAEPFVEPLLMVLWAALLPGAVALWVLF